MYPIGDVLINDDYGSQYVGVPFASDFGRGVVNYAKDQGVELTAKYGKSSMSFEEAIDFIKEGLSDDSPVALLMWENSNLPDFSMHWMTITGITENNKTGDVSIDISSWGKKYTLDFDKVWNSNDTFRNNSLVYFDK